MKITCRKMTKFRLRHAELLLDSFLRNDVHYLNSRDAYGDLGRPALKRALAIFLRRNDLGFVWLAYASGQPAGACVVTYAISTSIGGLVAKLDDVCIAPKFQRRGVATAMLRSLVKKLKDSDVRRIDTSVYRRNRAAARFYKNIGFRPLGEERLARVL
jgi:ribosomal protein S18 acetylase RimI-like enzyme